MSKISIQDLEVLALPAGAVTKNDIPEIETTIQKVFARIHKLAKPAEGKSDFETIKSCILAFQNWLRNQGCISQASTTYNIENTSTYSDHIFITYPGQLPFDIVFRMSGDVEQPYRLLIFVTTYDIFSFGSFVENNSKEEVFIPKNWPKDASSYWGDQP